MEARLPRIIAVTNDNKQIKFYDLICQMLRWINFLIERRERMLSLFFGEFAFLKRSPLGKIMHVLTGLLDWFEFTRCNGPCHSTLLDEPSNVIFMGSMKTSSY